MKEAPKFGPGIIGQEEYDRQLAEIKSNPGKFGPAVLNRVHGPEITGKAAPEPPVEAPAAPETNALSVKKLRELLEQDAGLMGSLLQDELDRVEGPRKSALRELAKAGRQAGDTGFVDKIEAILEGLE